MLLLITACLLQAAAKVQEPCKGLKKLDIKTQGIRNLEPSGP